MLAFIAAIIFIIAFILRVTHTSTDLVFSSVSLLIAGLALLALHLGGAGGWRISRPEQHAASAGHGRHATETRPETRPGTRHRAAGPGTARPGSARRPGLPAGYG